MSRGRLRRALRTVAPAGAIRLYRQLQRVPRTVRCRVRGLEIHIGVSSPIERWRVATYADKEPETLDWIDRHLRDDDVFWDIGANVGLYALYAAKRRGACRVYAFEPAATNYARLSHNIVLNQLTNVVPSSIAVAGRSGLDLLHVYDVDAGAALNSCGEPALHRSGDRVVLRELVCAATLDDLVHVHGLPQPTLIKIDVDGLEPQILAGGRRVLAAPKLRALLVELVEPASAEVAGLLSAGFEVTATGAPIDLRRPDGETYGVTSQNYVFARLPG